MIDPHRARGPISVRHAQMGPDTIKSVRLVSPALTLRVDTPCEPLACDVDRWHIVEHFHVSEPSSFGRYHVSMEHILDVGEDAGSAYINGETHARALEKAWLYGTGGTLGWRGYNYYLVPAELPSGWTSNAEDVVPPEEWRLLKDGTSFEANRRTMPTLPLRSCVEVLWALTRADDVLVQLTTYHLGAVTTSDPDLYPLLFAQALDVARALLPGRDKREQTAMVPDAVARRLPNGLGWLYEIANQRRQTRHAIDKKAEVSLKPDLADAETEAFVSEASVLIQYIVSLKLGVPLVIDEDGTSVVVDIGAGGV